MPLGFRILAVVQFWFGVMVVAGSCFEIVNVLVPSVLPTSIQAALDASPTNLLHRQVVAVTVWVVASNAVNFAVGAGFGASAVGLWHGREDARRWARGLSIAFIASALLGQVVLAAYIYPHMHGVLFAVTVSASLGALILPAFIAVFLGSARARRCFA